MPVATAASRGIEEPLLQVVLTEEPVERPPPVHRPAAVVTHAEGVETCRRRRARLDRLLVERRRRRTACIEPVGSNRGKLLLGRRLHGQQPLERALVVVRGDRPDLLGRELACKLAQRALLVAQSEGNAARGLGCAHD